MMLLSSLACIRNEKDQSNCGECNRICAKCTKPAWQFGDILLEARPLTRLAGSLLANGLRAPVPIPQLQGQEEHNKDIAGEHGDSGYSKFVRNVPNFKRNVDRTR